EVKYQSLENTIVGLSHKWLLREDVKDAFTDLVVKARSVRNRGSAALDFTYVAEGKYGAAVFYKLFPWDFAGGRIIANELGIKVVTLTNEEVPVLESSSIVAGHKDLVDEILEIFNHDTFKENHDKLYKKNQSFSLYFFFNEKSTSKVAKNNNVKVIANNHISSASDTDISTRSVIAITARKKKIALDFFCMYIDSTYNFLNYII